MSKQGRLYLKDRFLLLKHVSIFPTVCLPAVKQQGRRGHICCSRADAALMITAGKLAYYCTENERLQLPTGTAIFHQFTHHKLVPIFFDK